MKQEELKILVYYHPESGDFVHLNGYRAGRLAGSLRPDRYFHLLMNGKHYLAHRLAFLYMTGEWPIQIDHINHIRSDNSWKNLRNATHSQNKMNTRIQKNNSIGLKGVGYDKRRNKYVANIKRDRISYFLGYFETAEEAYMAYVKTANELHGEFAHV